ncbi:hypothetical protein DFP72DRAFT_853817 [Ephemerocybe angulata]|uniref:Uncharacterized protein n=1 Tax=Ephemerocybe angulata TaxID=980116 RepID=A0A8H6LZW9_9AGAR|nr:hypothetical protein DFP72DRAFT_853817 [Tulosesus angulatus]
MTPIPSRIIPLPTSPRIEPSQSGTQRPQVLPGPSKSQRPSMPRFLITTKRSDTVFRTPKYPKITLQTQTTQNWVFARLVAWSWERLTRSDFSPDARPDIPKTRLHPQDHSMPYPSREFYTHQTRSTPFPGRPEIPVSSGQPPIWRRRCHQAVAEDRQKRLTGWWEWESMLSNAAPYNLAGQEATLWVVGALQIRDGNPVSHRPASWNPPGALTHSPLRNIISARLNANESVNFKNRLLRSAPTRPGGYSARSNKHRIMLIEWHAVRQGVRDSEARPQREIQRAMYDGWPPSPLSSLEKSLPSARKHTLGTPTQLPEFAGENENVGAS